MKKDDEEFVSLSIILFSGFPGLSASFHVPRKRDLAHTYRTHNPLNSRGFNGKRTEHQIGAVDGAENEQNAIRILGYFRANLGYFTEKSWLFCRPARSTTATATPHRPSSPAMGKKYDFFCL